MKEKREASEKGTRVSFREQSPRVYLTPWERETLYDKAFLRPEEEHAGEYDRNTTTWD